MKKLLIHRSISMGESGGDTPSPIDINNYLTIEALKDGLTASLSANAVEYCIDGDGDWKSLSAGTATPAINTGQTLSFRGEIVPASGVGCGNFTISQNCNILGTVMSLVFGDEAAEHLSLSGLTHPFMDLFRSCSKIISVSENLLPATTISAQCYRAMFRGCSALTNAPKLPAKTCVSSCYYQMFYGCTKLANAPELPATKLATSCYNYMFYGCKALKVAPVLSAMTLGNNSYQYMFQNCTGLTTPPELPATTLTSYCYDSMFIGCTGLTTTGTLAATTLANYCYSKMFQGCTKLTNAVDLPATTVKQYSYSNMFKNCTALKKAPAISATTLDKYCFANMFNGCTSLIIAPELSVLTVPQGGYQSMFRGCTSLDNIVMLATDVSAGSCLSNWTLNVAASGTFVKNAAATWDITGVNGVPEGWTITKRKVIS